MQLYFDPQDIQLRKQLETVDLVKIQLMLLKVEFFEGPIHHREEL